MTADTIQNKYSAAEKSIELTREEPFINGTHDILDLLAQRSREKERLDASGLLILVDVENFETVETKYGTEAALACLKLVKTVLDSEVRSTDVIKRLNNGEFALLLPGTTAEVALERVQNLSVRLNRLSLVWKAQEIHINASVSLKHYRASYTQQNEGIPMKRA